MLVRYIIKYSTIQYYMSFYFILYLYFISGLKYIYLLIFGDYSVLVENPNQRTNLTNEPINLKTN